MSDVTPRSVNNSAQPQETMETRKLLWCICITAVFIWSTCFWFLAIPGEVRHIDRLMLCQCMTTEHGWPVVWLDKQTMRATTAVKPPSENWAKAKEEAQEQFDERCNEKSVMRFAELENNFSPQWFPPPADSFWSRSETQPWADDDVVFLKVRWVGFAVDLLVWFVGVVAILFVFRFIKSRRISFKQLSIRTSLFLLGLACIVLAGYAFYDRSRDREQEVVESLRSEPAISLDFTSNAPVWLDRLTDYRLRDVWNKNKFKRGLPLKEVADLGLFDQVMAIRLRSFNPDGLDDLDIGNPFEAARAVNKLAGLENIWVDCKDSPAVNSLLPQINSGRIRWLSLCRSFRFDSKKISLTHFSNLDGLYIENAGHVGPGFVRSFPKLKILSLRPDSIDDKVIDEIVALEDLNQLVIQKIHGGVLTEEQIERLEKELIPRSVKLYIRP